MNRRRGHTLIELLVLITVGSTLMGIAAGALHLLFKMEHNGRQRRELQASQARLADQFRRDVRAAQRLKPSDAPNRHRVVWQLELGAGEAIQYRCEPGGVSRSEISQGKPGRQEWYPLADSSEVQLETTSEGPAQIVSLRIASLGEPDSAIPSLSLRVDARLAGRHRFEGRSEGVPGKEGSP